jgi:hypothetical protein
VMILILVGCLFIFKYDRILGIVFATSVLLFLLCLAAMGATEIVRQMSLDYCYEVRYRYPTFSTFLEPFSY